jgi:acyl carrier protein
MDTRQLLKDETLKRLEIVVTDEDIDSGMSLKEKGIDSLDSIELLVSIEDAMGVDFTDEALEELNNLKDLMDYLLSFEQ